MNAVLKHIRRGIRFGRRLAAAAKHKVAKGIGQTLRFTGIGKKERRAISIVKSVARKEGKLAKRVLRKKARQMASRAVPAAKAVWKRALAEARRKPKRRQRKIRRKKKR